MDVQSDHRFGAVKFYDKNDNTILDSFGYQRGANAKSFDLEEGQRLIGIKAKQQGSNLLYDPVFVIGWLE